MITNFQSPTQMLTPTRFSANLKHEIRLQIESLTFALKLGDKILIVLLSDEQKF